MAYKIATVSNIPIYIDWSLVLLLFFMISDFNNPVLGIAVGIGVAASIALHELGHSLVAQSFGCRVRDITLMMLGGCATIVDMPRKAWQEFLMAAAGPLVSVLIGALCLASVLLLHIDPLSVSTPAGYSPGFLFWVGWINIMLCLFNLLPAFPMDGGRILRAFLQQFFMTRLRATWVASRIGRFIALLMGLSVVYSFLTHRFEGYMLIRLLIAYYIYSSAEREYKMVLMEEGTARQRWPFGGFPFFGGAAKHTAPPDDGKAVVSPPPYARGGVTRVDVRKE
ncbi:MAG TPA: site-2 protease family protein [Kiritimatiellia bacterium]|nr:site-2 protease family protein [Kiritimatiellia bacterium]HRU71108.1 site-2 protease family protein [Kiritimatiellia bacterium]